MLIKLAGVHCDLWLNATTVTNVRSTPWAPTLCFVDVRRRSSPLLIDEPADSLRARLEALTSKDSPR